MVKLRAGSLYYLLLPLWGNFTGLERAGVNLLRGSEMTSYMGIDPQLELFKLENHR
jgi:hypothetical protein